LKFSGHLPATLRIRGLEQCLPIQPQFRTIVLRQDQRTILKYEPSFPMDTHLSVMKSVKRYSICQRRLPIWPCNPLQQIRSCSPGRMTRRMKPDSRSIAPWATIRITSVKILPRPIQRLTLIQVFRQKLPTTIRSEQPAPWVLVPLVMKSVRKHYLLFLQHLRVLRFNLHLPSLMKSF
jgi:hypothetical protein